MREKLINNVRPLSMTPRTGLAKENESRLPPTGFHSSSDLHGNEIFAGRVLVPAPISLQELRKANRQRLKLIFGGLSPPALDSLDGEYNGELLDQGGKLRTSLTSYVFQMYGSWTGKAFHPLSENNGEGYNCFDSHGMIVPKLSMDTSIETSALDNQHSLIIRYGAKNRGLIGRLVGEIRQISPSLLLGVGVYPAFQNRQSLLRKIHFALSGPVRPYQHLTS